MFVGIVGGGVTGLTSAYLLLKQGTPVTLFEAAPREGGLGASFRRGDFSFDFGPHEFCTDNPALLELLPEICGDDLLSIEKRTAQHFFGRYVRYPFEIGDLLRKVRPGLCARVLFEVACARARNLVRPPKDESFEAWTAARFGRTLYEHYFGPYTEKVWGLDPSQLDPHTAADRVTVDSIWDLIRKVVGYQLFGREDFDHTHSEFHRRFFYVRRGMGTLQTHLRRKVEELGGRFEFGKRLVAMRRDPAAGVEALEFADGTSAEGFSHVLSTIPLPTLVEAALGTEGSQLVQASDLPFRGMVFVFLRIARPHVHDFHWIYYPDADLPFQRITEFSHFEAEMCPPGHTGLALEWAANPGQEAWEAADADVVAKCVQSLEGLGLVRPGDVVGADVVRVRHAYPLQVVGFQDRVETMLSRLEDVPNLVTLGRQGLFRYCNMNECMEMALDVVPRIVAGERSIRCQAPGTWKGVAITDRVLRPARRQTPGAPEASLPESAARRTRAAAAESARS